MKSEEIRKMTIDEMSGKAEELKQEFFNLKLQHATGQIENPLRIRFLRRDISRLMTIMAEKQRGEGS